jgi:hypothetical protein
MAIAVSFGSGKPPDSIGRKRMVKFLDEARVRAVLRWELIAAMERALAAFSSGG